MASLEGVSLEFTAGFTAGDRTLLSSVGGFSQPNRRQIRSLQELLGTIRPLGLEFIQGHALQEQKWLGEGVSYKVFKCRQRSTGRVVAVKQIKLPSASSQEAFDRQVACVLRDIEVMSHGPLAGHENVLNILGYGWNFRGSGSIPFLVTEFASSGTLRDYLRRYRLPSRDRLLMCVNVARGLHELHLCGMAHGDLKLDNVLVTPRTSAQSGPQEFSSQSVVAKISDFGHSLLLYEDDEAKEDQKYGGTLAYNAPEIARSHGLDYQTLNFRKCDVWALGLLCWEALENGSPYYKSDRIQDLIAFTKTDSRSTSDHSTNASKGSTSTGRGTASTTESILGSLSALSNRLEEVAIDFLDSETVGDLYSFEKGKLRELFQATLNVNPDQRVADIPMLPLLLKTEDGTSRSKLGQSSGKSAEWSFEVYRPVQVAQIPYVVKEQILNDCRRLGSEAGRSIASAHAAFHVSLAYLLGFGTNVDTHLALEWAKKSSFKGLTNAATLHELITETYLTDRTSEPLESQQRYTKIVREAFRRVEIPYLDAIPSTTTLTYAELQQIAADHDRENQENDVQTPFYFAHFAVRHGLTKWLSKADKINLQSGSTGETPLILACQLGDIQAVYDLLLVGADRNWTAFDGSLPIHFICMFPPEDMKLAAYLLLGAEDYRLPRPTKEDPLKSQPSVQTAFVKYDFKPKEDNELPLTSGEDIVITAVIDEEWWEGYNARDESGRFPRMFVEVTPEVASALNDQANASSAKNHSLIDETKIESQPINAKASFPTPENHSDAENWCSEKKGRLAWLLNDKIVSEPRYLDRQFPLELVGTPLAFAIAVGSQNAVELLLHLGASPIIGPRGWVHDSRNKSPIHLATSLHLVNILDLLMQEIARMWPNEEAIAGNVKSCLETACMSIAESSQIERTFIHGRHMQRVIGEMLFYWRELPGPISQLPPLLTTEALITASIEMGDIAIADAELPRPQRSEDGTMESLLSVDDRNLLMLVCTKVACSGAFDTPTCHRLLEFALSRGSRLDCDLGGTDEQKAINTAIEFHRREALDWFIENGASLNMKDNKGSYPIHYLINSGFSGSYPIKKLLDAGANPNVREGRDFWEVGDTALQLAIKKDRVDDVSLLLQHGADPSISCGEGEETSLSALHCAIRMGNLPIISILLNSRSSEPTSDAIDCHRDAQKSELLSQRDGAGNTPLLAAALKGDLAIVNVLLEAGADISAVNSSPRRYNGYNSMHCAASQRHDALLSIFAKQIDMDLKTHDFGFTALHLVANALKKDPESASRCCRTLLEAGADPRIPDNQGYTSLYWIASSFAGNDEEQRHRIRRPLLDLIVERGIGLDHRSTGWQVPCMLHQAVDNHDLTFVRDLLELGASVDILDSVGWTPLRRCVSLGTGSSFKKPGVKLAKICTIAEILIDKGADIYVLDQQGVSLLEHAVLSRNAPMAHLLLKHHEVGFRRVPPKPGNTVMPLVSIIPLAEPSVAPPKPRKRDALAGRFRHIMKPKEISISKEAQLRSKREAEARFHNVGTIDRGTIITAWKVAVTRGHCDSVAAFMDRNLHGETDILSISSSLKLLRYALEEDIGTVLMLFMGSYQHLLSGSLIELRGADSVLLETWHILVQQLSDSRRAKDMFPHSLGRVSQLILAGGFTPLLDLPSLVEKHYLEAQQEQSQGTRNASQEENNSLKEVVVSNTETEVAPPIIALFDEEEENEEYGEYDEEVQAQLNSLLKGMRVKSGIFLPQDTLAERTLYLETATLIDKKMGNSNGFVQGEGGKPFTII